MPADDTTLTDGDIPLPDAKTHQFFAFRGELAVYGQNYTFRPFTDPAANTVDLPLWITHADVQRAAAASAKLMGVPLSPDSSDLPDDAVLETLAPLNGQWSRMTPDDKRVPILARQTRVPVLWKLADVPAGVYSLAGYIFSPPYNGWAIRTGVVKIRDAEHDPPAGQIASVADTVFSYEGRKVSVCLDVPDGTTVDGFYLQADRPDASWQSWFHDRPATTGQLELCFHSRSPELSGSVRLRLVLRAPGGDTSVLQSSETITWLQGTGQCDESSTRCCAFDEAPVQPSLSGVTAGALGTELPLMAAGARAAMAGSAAPAAGSGCQILPLPAAGSPSWLAPLLGLGWRLGRRRARNAQRSAGAPSMIQRRMASKSSSGS